MTSSDSVPPLEPIVDTPAGAASRAARAEEDKATFLVRLAAGLAHEIKNPLSTMAINLALLDEEWGGARRPSGSPEPGARELRCLKRVHTLQREVRRLETIVEDFLRFARGGEINRAPADLCALLREVLEFVEPEDRVCGIRHLAQLPAGLPLVMLDTGAFRQAILNLLVNARQAMPEGGELIVRVERQGNFVELTVTDTGVGMPPEDIERIFELYYSTKKGGTGLGLPTTRRIVEEHEGTITVVSEKGRGTSFSIVLPLLVEIHGTAAEGRGEESR
ncbi:MAG: ATP-binding protein [Planctomycetes bacterium]|nr:ATP-binding protein [Planctomycetota bacterium]